MWVFLLLAIAYAQSSFLETIAPLVKAPLILKEVALGKTVLGKSLAVYILTKHDFTSMRELQGREAVLLDSYMHAREPYSFQLMQALAQDIVGRGGKGDMGEFLQEGTIIFYPFVNPDGYQLYTETGNIDVRKNRNPAGAHCTSGLPGVDINRNFPANFGIIPESSKPCSEEYHGTEPFSQSESLVFKELFETFRILIAIDIHSYGNEWIYPYASDLTGRRVKEHPLYPFYQSIKNQLAERRRKVRSCIESLGYIADGVYIDWALDQGALSFAFEVGSTFHSDRQSEIQSDIQAAIDDFYIVFKRTLKRYDTKTRANSLLLQSKSLSRINITVQIGNRSQIIELDPGKQKEVNLETNDTLAKIINHANGQIQVLSLRLRNLDSILTPTTIIILIMVVFGGLLGSFYSRWQRLHRRYSNVHQASTATEQQLPQSARQASLTP